MTTEFETRNSTRERPWHGIGRIVAEAPILKSALELAGLDWDVIQEEIYTDQNELIEGFKCDVRDYDMKILGGSI